LTLLASLHSLALFERIGVHGGAFPDRAVKNIVSLIVAGIVLMEWFAVLERPHGGGE
jgi:hypothetical protein